MWNVKIIGTFNKQSRNSVLNVKIIGTLKQAERRLRLSLIVKLQTLRRFGSNSRHGSYCVRRYTAQYEGVDVLTLPRLQRRLGVHLVCRQHRCLCWRLSPLWTLMEPSPPPSVQTILPHTTINFPAAGPTQTLSWTLGLLNSTAILWWIHNI